VLRIGVISDTHGILRPEAEQRLAGLAHIIHAGDIGRPETDSAGLRLLTQLRGTSITDRGRKSIVIRRQSGWSFAAEIVDLGPHARAGPRRFNLPVTLATLDLTASGPKAMLHHLISVG
jgi:hypothetical protein